MQHISPSSLTHLPSRIAYLRSFISFTEDDTAALHASRPYVAPLVSTIVDAVYTKLLSFDITAKAFVPRQTGYASLVPTSLNDLSHEHPQIKFRKDFLKQYVVKLVTLDWDKDESWEYLDKVGIMHTGVAGFAHRAKKPGLRVEYIHCGILLAFVEDIIIDAVANHPELDDATKVAVLRAFNKLIWIQNDLFARHYVRDADVESRRITFDRSTAAVTAAGFLALGAAFAQYVLPRLRS